MNPPQECPTSEVGHPSSSTHLGFPIQVKDDPYRSCSFRSSSPPRCSRARGYRSSQDGVCYGGKERGNISGKIGGSGMPLTVRNGTQENMVRMQTNRRNQAKRRATEDIDLLKVE